jgi:hypothetical protein
VANALSNTLTNIRDVGRILRIKGRDFAADIPGYVRVTQEIFKRSSRYDESRWNGYAGSRQFTKACALSADTGPICKRQIGKPADV